MQPLNAKILGLFKEQMGSHSQKGCKPIARDQKLETNDRYKRG